jgi:hypothetical protein
MGILRKGYYTRGYKTFTQIGDLTGMKQGDTVFDTTFSFRRIYDGFNWVSGSQISIESRGIPSGGNQINGSVSRPSTLVNNSVASANFIGTTGIYTSNSIGVIQTPIVGGVTIGSKGCLQYSNIGYVAVFGSVSRGNWLYVGATEGRADDSTNPPPDGAFGIALQNGLSNSIILGFIRFVDTATTP